MMQSSSDNALVRALSDAHAALAVLRDQATVQRASSELTPDELRQATLLLAALGHHGWAAARCLSSAHRQGSAGADRSAAAVLGAVAEHFADGAAAAAAVAWPV